MKVFLFALVLLLSEAKPIAKTKSRDFYKNEDFHGYGNLRQGSLRSFLKQGYNSSPNFREAMLFFVNGKNVKEEKVNLLKAKTFKRSPEASASRSVLLNRFVCLTRSPSMAGSVIQATRTVEF